MLCSWATSACRSRTSGRTVPWPVESAQRRQQEATKKLLTRVRMSTNLLGSKRIWPFGGDEAMLRRVPMLLLGVATGGTILPPPRSTDAAVLCRNKKSGAVFIRDACRRKETSVDAVAL